MTYTVTISYTTESERSDNIEEVRQHYIDMMRNGELTAEDFEIDIVECRIILFFIILIMKLYTKEKVKLVWVEINKVGSEKQYLSIQDASVEQVVEFIKMTLRGVADPFAQGKKTSIQIREYTGGKLGTGETVSMYGVEPLEAKEIIIAGLSE